MKINKIMIVAVMLFGTVSVADAIDIGGGKVTFSGTVIDGGCFINPDSVDQSIQFDPISLAALAVNGQTGSSSSRSFEISVENCEANASKSSGIKITFDGPVSPYDQQSLAPAGEAGGIFIPIEDENGRKIPLGVPFDLGYANLLKFKARVQGGGSEATLQPGEFSGTVAFNISYP